jgi:cytochrome c oxidase accessory protein FixG
MSQLAIDTESFRDSLSILTKEGKRKWIYPRFQGGAAFIKRNITAYLLLAVLVSTPFIKVHGHPLFLFNIIERTFIIWGIPFFPQDFFLFTLATLTFLVFIIFFTSLFGRWWCGYACPQTIFMEFIFRRIEYWIEGDAMQRKNLDKSEWNFTKTWKKTLKHLIFFIISFFISNIFLAYIIGSDQLWKIICEPVSHHTVGFTAIIIFSGVFYGVFAFLREQVCIGICPYGRLQGVLLDKDSMVVSYDFKRGEPRGKIGSTTGDCIDCHLCVAVCPTGIDIRNGTQLECINCAACIDACNSIMEKVERPKGLIRIASENQIERQEKKIRISTRMIGYAALWTVLISVLSYLTFTRAIVDATILRAPGQLYQQKNDSTFTNLYTINLVNKSFDDHNLELKVTSPQNASINVIGKPLSVLQAATSDGAFFIQLPNREVRNMKTPVSIDIIADGKKIGSMKTDFIGPVSRKDHNDEDHHDDQEKGSDNHD